MNLQIPITDRSRKYGYVFWTADYDQQIRRLLGDAHSADVIFDGKPLGEKSVDWRFRRIPVGWRQTRRLPPDVSTFTLKFGTDGRLRIESRK